MVLTSASDVDFVNSNIESTILFYFIRNIWLNGPTEIRTHDRWIRFYQHNIFQRPSGYAAATRLFCKCDS
jgi:hypothetical protein